MHFWRKEKISVTFLECDHQGHGGQQEWYFRHFIALDFRCSCGVSW